MPVTRAKKTTANASLFGTNWSSPTDQSKSTQVPTTEAPGVPARASKRRKIEHATPELAAPEAQDEEDGQETEPGSLENWRVQLAQRAAAVRPHENRAQGPTFAKSGSRMKVESLPILDNLSTQVLSTYAKLSLKDILLLVGNPESEHGQEYFAIKSLFDATKKVYTNDRSFLWQEELDLDQPYHSEVLRKANMATFVATLFEPSQIDFAEWDAHFLRIFVPDSGRILKAHASIFLELKTQAFIASRASPEGATEQKLEEFFSNSLESKLLARRPGARGLAPSEHDFIKRTFSRRDILRNDLEHQNLDDLPARYRWDDFLKEVSVYVSKNIDTINASISAKEKAGRSSSNNQRDPPSQTQLESNFAIQSTPIQQVPPEPVTPAPPVEKPAEPPGEDFVARAARAAQKALQGHGPSSQSFFPRPQMSMHAQQPPKNAFQQVQISPAFQQYIPPSQANGNSSRTTESPNYGSAPELPHVSQTAPTQVLYERARMVNTAKASPTNRRAGLPSQRRPWTTEEENSLMAGLDRVRGPHWSQILSMFGPGGTINETLKDRNQVQLKDKARNLKLFFLKSQIEVPYYLKYVTGDLKTRAPAQASKNEAREREKQQGEEDKAHYDGVQGIMALAGASSIPGDLSGAEITELGKDNGLYDPALSADPMIPDMDSSMQDNLDPSLPSLEMPSALGEDVDKKEKTRT